MDVSLIPLASIAGNRTGIEFGLDCGDSQNRFQIHGFLHYQMRSVENGGWVSDLLKREGDWGGAGDGASDHTQANGKPGPWTPSKSGRNFKGETPNLNKTLGRFCRRWRGCPILEGANGRTAD